MYRNERPRSLYAFSLTLAAAAAVVPVVAKQNDVLNVKSGVRAYFVEQMALFLGLARDVTSECQKMSLFEIERKPAGNTGSQPGPQGLASY